VEKGTTLLRLESTRMLALKEAAHYQVEAARAAYEELLAGERKEKIHVAAAELSRTEASKKEAGQNYTRINKLFRRKAATLDKLEQAKRRLDVAEAEVAASKERLKLLKIGFRKEQIAQAKARLLSLQEQYKERERALLEMEIQAPFEGQVNEIFVEVGDWVSPGKTILELVDSSVIDIMVNVPEKYIQKVVPGRAALCNFDRIEPKISIQGTIRYLGPLVTEEGRTFPVVVRAENQKRIIRPGMSVNVAIPVGPKKNVLLIPKDAILRRDNKTTLYVAKGDKAESRNVTLGQEVGNLVVVQEGISMGEKVIDRGNERIRPGSKIKESKKSNKK
ncbi:efflux RND transporter periplasmic adaptor subunit, partial [Candidatus Riflebacteria bacterium]